MDSIQRRVAAVAALLIAVGCLASFAQDELPDFQSDDFPDLAPGATAIEALVKVRGAIGAATEAGDLPELRFWLRLAERGLPGKRVLWLWPNERLLLAFWLGEYRTALAVNEAAPSGVAGPRAYLPPDDLLFRRLQAASAGRREELKEAVRGSGLKEDERYFLLLLLDFLLKLDPLRQEEQLQLNRAAAYFVRRFPGSPYGDYATGTIAAPVLRPSPWAIGFDAGPAYAVFLGELSSDFTEGWGAGGGVDVSFRRLVAGVHAQLTTSSTRRRLSSGWDPGITVDAFAPEFSLGYLLVASRRLKLAPFVGAGWLSMSPEPYGMPLQAVRPNLWIPTYVLGLDLDLRGAVLSYDGALKKPRTSLVLSARATVSESLWDIDLRFEPVCFSLAVLVQIFHRPLRK